MIRVSILGATGYSGGELIRLLLNHSGVSLQHVTSESSSGRPVSELHPFLNGRLSHKFEKFKPAKIAKDSDVVFSCFPPTVGLKSTAKLVNAGIKVIDLSADYRLPTASLFKTWYKKSHPAPRWLKKRVYGIPEINREKIADADLVANPGCYATAAILSARPLLRPLVVNPRSLIIDAKSGVSGAGRKVAAKYIYCEVDENLQAYAVASHRHQPEIEMALNKIGPASVQVTLTPHLIPMERGILSVLYASLKKPMQTSKIRNLYLKAYQNEPFVKVLPDGVTPQTKNVKYTNNCEIGIFQDSRNRRVIVVAAIDNLVKGAAGQAIQNMNLLFNHSETEGLL